MLEALQRRVNEDAGLVRRGRYLTTSFLLEVGSTAFLISIFEGRVVAVTQGPFVMPSSTFALRAPEAIALSDAPDASGIAGTVSTRTYLGDKVQYGIDISGAELHVVEYNPQPQSRLVPGSRVTVRLPTETLHLLRVDEA